MKKILIKYKQKLMIEYKYKSLVTLHIKYNLFEKIQKVN